MALVTTKNMFEKAFKGNYSIGAFNINNMEIIQGVIEACKKHNSAVILQVSKSALKYAHPLYPVSYTHLDVYKRQELNGLGVIPKFLII